MNVFSAIELLGPLVFASGGSGQDQPSLLTDGTVDGGVLDWETAE